jgi:hypothetical protein
MGEAFADEVVRSHDFLGSKPRVSSIDSAGEPLLSEKI